MFVFIRNFVSQKKRVEREMDMEISVVVFSCPF